LAKQAHAADSIRYVMTRNERRIQRNARFIVGERAFESVNFSRRLTYQQTKQSDYAIFKLNQIHFSQYLIKIYIDEKDLSKKYFYPNKTG
jgi:hypothetical protein